jgi:hypothetical protein
MFLLRKLLSNYKTYKTIKIMSQSDYLKYKRVATILKIDNNTSKQPRVFACQDYTNFKEFTLENTIIDTDVRYNNLTPSGDVHIFGMNKSVTNCPTFPVCKNTNLRTNRVANSTVYFTPRPQPITIKKFNESTNMKTHCKCGVNAVHSKKYNCQCAVGRFGIVR